MHMKLTFTGQVLTCAFVSTLGLCSLLTAYQACHRSGQNKGLLPADHTYSEVVNNPGPQDIPRQFHPVQIAKTDRAAGTGNHQPHDSLEFHWVVTTCVSRQNWGRFLSSTLLSAALNGLQPTTINIMVCEPLNQLAHVPALLYNLQHAHDLNIFHAPRDFPTNQSSLDARQWLQQQYWRTYSTALLVPAMLNRTDIPVLITADDVLFAPYAHTILKQSVKALAADGVPISDNAVYINAHQSSTVDSNHGSLSDGTTASKRLNASEVSMQRDMQPGSQAVLMSAKMRQLLVDRFIPSRNKPVHDGLFQGHIQEEVMRYITNDLKCNQQGSACHAFRMQPSLTRHIGVTSRAQGQASSHIATTRQTPADFPINVKYPGLEPDTLWR